MTPSRRGMVAELLIAASLCAGVQLGVVEPRRQEAREALLSLEVAEGASGAPVPGVASEAGVGEVAARFEELSGASRDEAGLFAAISGLSTRGGVTLDRLDVSATGGRGQAVGARWYTTDARGEYGAIVGFVRSLEREVGLLSIREVRVTPGGLEAAGQVQASVRFEVFDVGVAVAGGALGEGGEP